MEWSGRSSTNGSLSPMTAIQHLLDSNVRHAELIGQCLNRDLIRNPSPADIFRLSDGQLSQRMVNTAPRVSRSSNRCMTPLPGHISQILGGRSKEQVARTYTRANVAMVADKQSRRNGSVNQLPHESMGRCRLATPIGDLAISSSLKDASPPQPTFSGRIHTRHERYRTFFLGQPMGPSHKVSSW